MHDISFFISILRVWRRSDVFKRRLSDPSTDLNDPQNVAFDRYHDFLKIKTISDLKLYNFLQPSFALSSLEFKPVLFA